MANPYRGGGETRVASGEGRKTASPNVAKKAGGRPVNNGQPTFPVGYPPDLSNPARGIGQGAVGPLAGNPSMPPSPMAPPPGFGPGGPANVSQGGPGGMLADQIEQDTLGKAKPGKGSGGKHGG